MGSSFKSLIQVLSSLNGVTKPSWPLLVSEAGSLQARAGEFRRGLDLMAVHKQAITTAPPSSRMVIDNAVNATAAAAVHTESAVAWAGVVAAQQALGQHTTAAAAAGSQNRQRLLMMSKINRYKAELEGLKNSPLTGGVWVWVGARRTKYFICLSQMQARPSMFGSDLPGSHALVFLCVN